MAFELNYGVIDAHVHIEPMRLMKPQALELMRLRQPQFDRVEELTNDPAALLRYMDSEGIERLVAINYLSLEVIGFDERVNRYAAGLARCAPSRVLVSGAVDPRRSNDPVGDTRRLADSGIRLIKIHPPHQWLYPNAYLGARRDHEGALPPAGGGDARGAEGLAAVYRTAEEIGLPIMFHTGTSIFPGARNKYGDPMLLDDVAVDFPKLKIIVAHGGRPLWMETAVFLVRRHPNVYLEISSIPPRRLLDYFPRLEELADKTIYGSDWPGPMVPGMAQNVRDFLALPLSAEAKRKILRANALRLLWNEGE